MISVPAVGSEGSYARFIQTRTIDVMDILKCLESAGNDDVDDFDKERCKRFAVTKAKELKRQYLKQ